jgi:eukaryotic-like serine/threonine-protein kinase
MNCQACGHENVDGARFCASCGAALPTRVESQNDPLVGQVIGNRYRITGVIGEGGMGVVYVGEQQMGSTVRKVAVKTLHPHLSKDANVLKRFHRECGTVAQLEHPNTIKVYDFGSTPDGTLYIAMEFVAGRPLSDVLLKEEKLSSDRVIQIVRQICGALDEAHQLGIVHRDLKPDNIILTPRAGEQDFVKVLDFGIAARTESTDAAQEQKLTQQGTVLGTPPYMSPEQFTGKTLDRRSDVYSLGVMTYEMLTGKLPFEADTPWQWATQHMTAQPRPFELAAPQTHIAEGMRQAILRALSKDPSQRQAGAGQFFTELSAGIKAQTEPGPNRAATGATPYQATAAMPEMPGFGGAVSAAGATPGLASAGSTVATPAVFAAPAAFPGAAPAAFPGAVPAVSPVAMPVAMIAAPRPRGGGKGGLVIGLSTAALAIIAVIVVVLVRSNKPAEDPSKIALSSASATPSAPATLSAEIPQDTAAQMPVPVPSVEPTLPRANTQYHPAAKPSTSAPTAASATPSANPVPTPSNPPATNPGAQPPPTGAQPNPACANCIAAASSGNLSQAGQYLNQCTDPTAKQQCQGKARVAAITAARQAVQAHDCAKVQQIKAAADAMGASSGPVTTAAQNCH